MTQCGSGGKGCDHTLAADIAKKKIRTRTTDQKEKEAQIQSGAVGQQVLARQVVKMGLRVKLGSCLAILGKYLGILAIDTPNWK